jgi:hypothetical protein
VFFAAPYFFLVAENHIEVRLVENGRKLETIEGNSFRLLNGMDGVHTSMAASPSGIDGESMLGIAGDQLNNDYGLLHLAMRGKDSDSKIDLMELQMEVLDLAPFV